MIQKETYLRVADNSGAKIVKCIGLYNNKKRSASIGDVILVSVKKYNPAVVTMKKGKKFKAVIISTKQTYKRKSTGMCVKFPENCVVLIDNNKLIGNRVFASTVREIKTIYPEITNLSPRVY